MGSFSSHGAAVSFVTATYGAFTHVSSTHVTTPQHVPSSFPYPSTFKHSHSSAFGSEDFNLDFLENISPPNQAKSQSQSQTQPLSTTTTTSAPNDQELLNLFT